MATTGKKKTAKTVETAETKLPKVLDIPTAVNALMAEAAGKSLSVNNITMSIDGLEAYVNETLPNYAPDKYTGDADAAKKDRAVLNGGLKQIADARKQIIAKAMEPFKLLETRMKTLEKQMENGSAALDAIVKEKEIAEKDAKKNLCLKIWNDKGFTLIDFELIFDIKWTNKTTKLEDVSKEIDTIINRIKTDIKTLEALPDADTLKAIYLQSLDLSYAMNEAAQLKANRERATAEAAARAAAEQREQIVSQYHEETVEYFEQQKEEKPVTLAAEVLGVEPDIDPITTYSLEFTGRKSDLIAMRTYMSEHGITYKKLETEGAY
jgi:hypothetical protein